jgi:hypothetical protein
MAWEGVVFLLVRMVVVGREECGTYPMAWQAQLQKMIWVGREGVLYYRSAEMLVKFLDMQKSPLGKRSTSGSDSARGLAE